LFLSASSNGKLGFRKEKDVDSKISLTVFSWAKFVTQTMNKPLYWYFKRWKHDHEDKRKPLKEMTKNELIEKILRDQ
jgi:hypothetical protein